MKITARLNYEDLEIVSILKAKNIKGKLVKGGIIADLPYDNQYSIPEELADATLLIDCSEHGGGMTNTGSGTVVCGLSGKSLKYYHAPRGGHLSCGTHAYFSVPGSVVTVTGYRRDENVSIQKHKIRRDGNTARIEHEIIWEGEAEFLPDMYKHYGDAIKAAQTKANCYHCRCIHYAA